MLPGKTIPFYLGTVVRILLIINRDDARETIGVFMCKGHLRQEENQYLELPPEAAKERNFSPQILRLLGYGIFPPALGLYKYKDPMEEIFGINDEETIHK